MRIAFFHDPARGGSPLTIGLERGLRELGHEVCHYGDGVANLGVDLILIFNQSAHTRDYVYPSFPPADDRTPIAFVDNAEYGWTKRVHEPSSRYWNAFAAGSMEHDTKNAEQQAKLREFLASRSFPYFVREFWNDYEFPPSYHPIDYPLYGPSTNHRPPNRAEYMRRSVDVACLWGWSNPWRVNLTNELEAEPSLRKDVYVIERDGPRLPQFGGGGYFQRIDAARCSIQFDGYGSGSFRTTEVLSRTLLMQGPLGIKTHAPLMHGETCWAYCVWVDGEHYVRSNLVEQITAALSDRERAYQIYERGYHHCMTHLTEKATAAYVLGVVEAHNWSKETAI